MKNLRDYPTLAMWSSAGLDMRCSCGAPLNAEMKCIISGKLERHCEAPSQPARDGDGLRWWVFDSREGRVFDDRPLRAEIQQARRSYFASLKHERIVHPTKEPNP